MGDWQIDRPMKNFTVYTSATWTSLAELYISIIFSPLLNEGAFLENITFREIDKIYLFIYYNGILHRTQEYFTDTTATSIMMVANRVMPSGNPRPTKRYWYSFQCMAGEEASLSWCFQIRCSNFFHQLTDQLTSTAPWTQPKLVSDGQHYHTTPMFSGSKNYPITCQAPMPAAVCANGLWKMRHILKESVRISVTLLSRAQKAAMGKAEENRKT